MEDEERNEMEGMSRYKKSGVRGACLVVDDLLSVLLRSRSDLISAMSEMGN